MNGSYGHGTDPYRYSYSSPPYGDSWQEQRDAEQRELAQVLNEERSRRSSQERAISALESELRRVLETTFDLTHDTKDRTTSQRNEYVSGPGRELAGKPACAWETQLVQSKCVLKKVELQVTVLQAELKQRTLRRFWATEVHANKLDMLRLHFRQQADHTKLLKELHIEAERYADRACTTGCSVPELQRMVDAQAQHKHVRAGEACPTCKKGKLVDRTRGFDGGKFVGCDRYPDCRHAWSVELGTTSPTAGSVMAISEAVAPTTAAIMAEPEEMQFTKASKGTSAELASALSLAGFMTKSFSQCEAGELCIAAGMDAKKPIEVPELNAGLRNDQELAAWAALLLEAKRQGKLDALQAACRKRLHQRFSHRTASDKVRALTPLWVQFQGEAAAPCTGAADGVTTDEKETVKQMAENKATTGTMSIKDAASLLFGMTVDDTGDAVWRSSADRAVDILKDPAKIALRKVRTGPAATGAKFLLKAIDHPIGEGIFSWCAGVTLVGYGPLRGKALGPRTARLSKELRVKGIKPITDLVSKTILDPVRKAIVTLVESLPEDANGGL